MFYDMQIMHMGCAAIAIGTDTSKTYKGLQSIKGLLMDCLNVDDLLEMRRELLSEPIIVEIVMNEKTWRLLQKTINLWEIGAETHPSQNDLSPGTHFNYSDQISIKVNEIFPDGCCMIEYSNKDVKICMIRGID